MIQAGDLRPTMQERISASPLEIISSYMNHRDTSFCCTFSVDNIISFGSDSEHLESCNRLRRACNPTLYKLAFNKRIGPFKIFPIFYCLPPSILGYRSSLITIILLSFKSSRKVKIKVNTTEFHSLKTFSLHHGECTASAANHITRKLYPTHL